MSKLINHAAAAAQAVATVNAELILAHNPDTLDIVLIVNDRVEAKVNNPDAVNALEEIILRAEQAQPPRKPNVFVGTPRRTWKGTTYDAFALDDLGNPDYSPETYKLLLGEEAGAKLATMAPNGFWKWDTGYGALVYHPYTLSDDMAPEDIIRRVREQRAQRAQNQGSQSRFGGLRARMRA